MNFDAAIRNLRDRIFPTEGRDGPTGDVPVDAQVLRELLARLGTCRLWNAAYRRALTPFVDAYREVQHEAALAESVGHMYPMEDDDTHPVLVGYLRAAYELLERK